jgi:mRNA interferase MazF
MKKGEVWIVEFPSVNGHEQSGTRPVIVLADTESNITIIIPFTSNIQALRFPYTLEIEPSKQNGLLNKSIALTFQLRAIDKKRLKTKVGVLEIASMSKIDKMLKKFLSL